jgi:hypothetical protein
MITNRQLYGFTILLSMLVAPAIAVLAGLIFGV